MTKSPDFLDPPPFEIAWQTAFRGCDRATAEAAYDRLLAEPTGPLKAPIRLTADHFGLVPRTCIETLSDKAVPLALQRAMEEQLHAGACSPSTAIIRRSCRRTNFWQKPYALSLVRRLPVDRERPADAHRCAALFAFFETRAPDCTVDACLYLLPLRASRETGRSELSNCSDKCSRRTRDRLFMSLAFP